MGGGGGRGGSRRGFGSKTDIDRGIMLGNLLDLRNCMREPQTQRNKNYQDEMKYSEKLPNQINYMYYNIISLRRYTREGWGGAGQVGLALRQTLIKVP